MKNKRLLFVTTRLFWPTDSGRKLRLYYYCKGIHENIIVIFAVRSVAEDMIT